MEERFDNNEIYSKKIRAGKRTYFFDIKPTRSNDYYITITESKKKTTGDGFVYEKHKIFLYKEDVKRFYESLQETVDYLKNDLMPHYDFERENEQDIRADEHGDYSF